MNPSEFEQTNDGLDSIVAMVAGYKAKLIEAGFDPDNAEYMAVEFHSLYIQQYVEVNTGGTNDD